MTTPLLSKNSRTGGNPNQESGTMRKEQEIDYSSETDIKIKNYNKGWLI
jgi:hypothetical protein